MLIFKAVQWLRWLVAGLLPRRSMFDTRSLHVRAMVDKVGEGKIFL